MNCLPENGVGMDTQDRHRDAVGEIDNESVSFEELSYYRTLLDDRYAESHNEAESALSGLAEETSCIVQCRDLRGRGAGRESSEGMVVWRNWFVGYFRMKSVEKRAKKWKAGLSVGWNVFGDYYAEFENVVVWHNEG